MPMFELGTKLIGFASKAAARTHFKTATVDFTEASNLSQRDATIGIEDDGKQS